MKSKICLGFDPGLLNTGWAAVCRNNRGHFNLIESGVITTDSKDKDAKRTLQIHTAVTECIEIHKPDLVAIERVFFNHNPSSCLSTAGVSYICQLAAEQAGIESATFTPQQVKAAVGCGGRASKQAVKMFVTKLTRTQISSNSHAADAIATAIAGLLRMQSVKERIQ